MEQCPDIFILVEKQHLWFAFQYDTLISIIAIGFRQRQAVEFIGKKCTQKEYVRKILHFDEIKFVPSTALSHF